jgi:receptor expression-enhancing protein 5/6
MLKNIKKHFFNGAMKLMILQLENTNLPAKVCFYFITFIPYYYFSLPKDSHFMIITLIFCPNLFNLILTHFYRSFILSFTILLSILTSAKEAGARPAFIFLGGLAFLTIFTLWKCGQNATSNLIGFVIPTYESFRALHTESTADDAQWLTYFVVYSFFCCVESVTDVFINWIPLYYLFKVLFLIWLMHPATLGAKVMFVRVIDPFLHKVEQIIEAFFDETKRAELKDKLASPDLSKLKGMIPTGHQEDFKKDAEKAAKKALA